MEKRITIEQLQELSDDQKKHLQESWKPRRGDTFYRSEGNLVLLVEAASDEGIESCDELISKQGCLPLLSIGQMIQLVEDFAISKGAVWELKHDWYKYSVTIRTDREDEPVMDVSDKDICNVLWMVTKQIL